MGPDLIEIKENDEFVVCSISVKDFIVASLERGIKHILAQALREAEEIGRAFPNKEVRWNIEMGKW